MATSGSGDVSSEKDLPGGDESKSLPAAEVLGGGGEEILDLDKLDDKGAQLVTEYPEIVQEIMETDFVPSGLEVYPFMIGWYNEKVDTRFQLDYPPETLAFVVLSGPDMFEKCIVPYAQLMLSADPQFSTDDALDDSMRHAFSILQEDLAAEGLETDIFHDFDLYPSRRPKVLVQTAAHVAGAVQYLHKNCLPQELQGGRFSEQSNLSGVAIHPRFGGWFGIRGVVIFTNLQLPEGVKLEKPEPLQIFKDIEVIAKVIELFAYNWETNEWRDVHKQCGEKYSPEFSQFLELPTSERWQFVKTFCDELQQSGEPEEIDLESENLTV